MNHPMPRGDLPEREDTDVHPVVPSVESPGQGTVPRVPSPENSATSVRRSLGWYIKLKTFYLGISTLVSEEKIYMPKSACQLSKVKFDGENPSCNL